MNIRSIYIKGFAFLTSLMAGVFLFTATASAQTEEEFPKLVEIKGKRLQEEKEPLQSKKGLWGYADQEGKYIIRPVFTDARPYEGKIARIAFGEKWGLISHTGLYIILPYFEKIERYSSDSLAIAKLRGDEFSLINTRGAIVTKCLYDSLDYADYGYHSYKDGKIGTISSSGEQILEPQFEAVCMLDRQKGVEQILSDGKWGLLKEGKEILAQRWDTQLELLQTGTSVDLYLARMEGRCGVVTSYGDFVIPCVYDEIAMASSGRYYTTRQGDYYGAISLDMAEIVPPVLDNKPFIGDDVFRFCDGSRFYSANVNGYVPFEDCVDLYQMFKPDDFLTTNSIPDWSKTPLLEENLAKRQEDIGKARLVCEALMKSPYNLSSYLTDTSLPEGIDRSVSSIDAEKYGILQGGSFKSSSGTVSDSNGNSFSLLYKAEDGRGGSVSYLMSSEGKYFVDVDGSQYSMAKIYDEPEIKKAYDIFPIDYTYLQDGNIMMRLSVDQVHTLVYFNSDTFAAESFVFMPNPEKERLVGSAFGGYYAYPSTSVIVDSNNPLRRYDANGVLDWSFAPYTGEDIYDIEETEDFIYLSGSVSGGSSQLPIILQLDKRGRKVKELEGVYGGSCYEGLFCSNHLMYVKVSKGRSPGNDYYPLYVMEDLGDNFGVHLRCAWEDWGGGKLGGCGLAGLDNKWLTSPVLKKDQINAVFERELSAFVSDYLVVRHRGLYGLVDRNGNLCVDAKYDRLEPLGNPFYFRAVIEDAFGVVDASGKVVVPLKYDSVGQMSDDIIIVGEDGKFGCYDKSGKMVVPVRYDQIREYQAERAQVRYKKWYGFIDMNGEICIPPFADEVGDFSEDCVQVTIKNRKGFVNVNGDWVAAPVYDDAGSYSGGLAYVSYGGKYGYIDINGNVVIPYEYSEAGNFSPEHGLAGVAVGGRWGVIDKTGRQVLLCDFDKVTITPDGYILVMNDNKYGLYSTEGICICPIIFDEIEVEASKPLFRHGTAHARLDGQRVRVDFMGNVVHPYLMVSGTAEQQPL